MMVASAFKTSHVIIVLLKKGQMKICSESVLDETYPGIIFDSQGVSNIAKQYKIDLASSRLNRQKNQVKLKVSSVNIE